MGQKVNPNFMRIGINKKASALWYANKKNYADFLIQDLRIRKVVEKILKGKQISDVKISRSQSKIVIDIYGASVALILGRESANVKKMLKLLYAFIKKTRIEINAHEVKNINADAQLIANYIAHQLENRVSFRYAQKLAIKNANFANVMGIKTQVSGRLNGADIARREGYSNGTLPLQTFNSRIDYATAIAKTTYGCIGVKVWVCNRENRYNNGFSHYNYRSNKNNNRKDNSKHASSKKN